MNHQFKAGDLALIVGAHRLTENIGKTCTLVQFLQRGERYLLPGGAESMALNQSWLIEGAGIVGLTYVCLTGKIERVMGAGLADPAHLMPLRGDFTPDLQKSSEVSA